jgi:PAP_fibrillin
VTSTVRRTVTQKSPSQSVGRESTFHDKVAPLDGAPCNMPHLRLSLSIALITLGAVHSAVFIWASSRQSRTVFLCRSSPSDIQGEILECVVPENSVLADRLKRELYQLGASFDRGFGASPSARTKATTVIEELERLNPESSAARGIVGGEQERSPLSGSWRMIWTTALDVLLLNASPIFIAGAIYQVFDPPLVTNVIDFLPRAQSLFPPDVVPNSLLRAKVLTKASPRQSMPNRVGLVFEKVQIQPLQVLGMELDMVPPLAFNLPKLPGTDYTEASPSSPGFFDVTYLDTELLIIRQNAPGGLFVLLKVDSIDP